MRYRHADYDPTTVRRYGVMLRLHRRHEYIEKIFQNFRALAARRELFLAIQLDRPSAEVAAALAKQIKNLPSRWTVDVFETPYALVTRRENYMLALQTHLEVLEELAHHKLDAASLWDDDMWLTKKGLTELKGHLDILEADRIEARSYFLWDKKSQANEAFPAHWQALLFRYYRGDKFPQDYIVHCPHRVAQGPYIRMENRLRNAGYLDPDDRRLTWEAYKKAGKVDAHTLQLVNDPQLIDLK